MLVPRLHGWLEGVSRVSDRHTIKYAWGSLAAFLSTMRRSDSWRCPSHAVIVGHFTINRKAVSSSSRRLHVSKSKFRLPRFRGLDASDLGARIVVGRVLGPPRQSGSPFLHEMSDCHA